MLKTGKIPNRIKQPDWLIILRVGLGFALIVKGIMFIQNNALIRQVFSDSLLLKKYLWLQTLIPWINLLGGVFIVVGLFTRLMISIQIPVLIGAIVFVGAKDGVYQGETGLLLSVSVLLLLVLFLIKGPGNNSLDHSLRFKKEN
jgi:putative oxidoreductase